MRVICKTNKTSFHRVAIRNENFNSRKSNELINRKRIQRGRHISLILLSTFNLELTSCEKKKGLIERLTLHGIIEICFHILHIFK